jgi:curli production assembly/transport component CsgG
VVGYDRRMIDGGNGVGVVGVRANERISRDQITVVIKLVNVATGEIIATGHSTKFVDSTLSNFGVFTFMGEDVLLEAESGIAVNEASSLALFHAIDGALQEVFGYE